MFNSFGLVVGASDNKFMEFYISLLFSCHVGLLISSPLLTNAVQIGFLWSLL